MSKILDKFVYKVLIVVVVAALWVGLRETLLTDATVSKAFGALMGELPFAKMIIDYICKLMKYSAGNVPVVSSYSVFTDFIRLLVMAVIQPLVVGLLTAIFLPMPHRNQILTSHYTRYEEQESYMDSFGYKLKHLLIVLITTPLIAVMASKLTGIAADYVKNNFSGIASIVLGGASALIALGVSVLSMVLLAKVSVGTALAWRLLITLGADMFKTFATEGLCLWIYVSILSGAEGQIFASIVSLILFLLVMEVGMKALRLLVVM